MSYHPETILLFLVTVTLTFDLVTSKSIGVICQSWSMYLWSFLILGLSVLELSSGNHLVDGRTYWQTDMYKTIYPLFFKGGHKKQKLYQKFNIWRSVPYMKKSWGQFCNRPTAVLGRQGDWGHRIPPPPQWLQHKQNISVSDWALLSERRIYASV